MSLSAPPAREPRRPSVESGYRAVAMLAGAALFCVVYAVAAWPQLGGPLSVPQLLAYGALREPLPAAQWPRLFSTWFIHVDLLHLAGNLAAWGTVWLPWPQSPRGGVWRRLWVFGICGFGASVATVLSSGPATGDQLTVSAGPSGALMGMAVVAMLQRGGVFWHQAIWLLTAAALVFGGVLTGGDTAAHLGGGLTGLGLGWALRSHPERAELHSAQDAP